MTRRKESPRPANFAAKALRDNLFRARKVKNGKTYSRKIKHRKGERDERFPFFMSEVLYNNLF